MYCSKSQIFYALALLIHLSKSMYETILRFTLVEDVDECLSGISDCQHLCINTVGGFNVECEFG